MIKSNAIGYKDPIKGWLILGVPILFVVGALMHFVYDLSGESFFVGIIAPVNESVWEHLKLTFWPMIIWWVLGYIIFHKKYGIVASRWILSGALAFVTCPLFIVVFFYTYTGAFGIESLLLDISSMLMALIVAHLLAYHVYKHSKTKTSIAVFIASNIVIILLIIAFTTFTIAPFHIPIFEDTSTGNYGF